jgi:hypothetical protein
MQIYLEKRTGRKLIPTPFSTTQHNTTKEAKKIGYVKNYL